MAVIGMTCNIKDSATVAADTLMQARESLAGHIKDPEQITLSVDYFLDNPDWDAYASLAGYSILMGIIVVVGLIFLRLCTKQMSIRIRDISLKVCFSVVWLYGFVVYDVGMFTGQYISLLTNAPMAILYAFKIFLFDSDVSEIHDAFHESWFYSMNFALVHFLAAAISTLFLIKYFGFNILARWKMMWTSILPFKKVRETYVFWGFNEQTRLLIESVKKHYKDIGSKDYRIVIVRTGKGDDDDKSEDRTVFARIFDFLSMRTSELDKLQKLGCLTADSYTNLVDINAESCKGDIIGKDLRLRSLRRILKKRTDKKIHLLFLTDDEKENLHDVSLLLNDSTINNFVKEEPGSEREVIFYCLARFNSIHRVIEDQNPSNLIKVKVVDSSHISVEMLKVEENKELLPVNYVTVEADATVSSPFNALVVGFSEVGQDSVRFLYEFGAFVKTGGSNEIADRSEFHLDVVDKNMSDLAGVFVANAPAIKPSKPFMEHDDNQDALIALHEMDCRSIQFYEKLKDEWIQKLNYIVVATEDDELNISLGVRIFKLATRYRKDMKKLCILVRAHNDDDGHIRRIAQHYNLLWNAYQVAPPDSKGKRIHQNEVTKDTKLKTPILHIFGLEKNTFTYDYIIEDKLEQNARKYAERYVKTTDPQRKINKTAFDDIFDEVMQLKEEWVGYYPTYFGMMLLRRTQSQDLANSLHEVTKRILKEEAIGRGINNFEFSKLTRIPKTTKYIWPRGEEEIEQINRIAIVIAQTEHLRWNASHEILGYTYDKEKDEVKCKHDCLKDWAALSELYRSYDCNVSDFILGIKFMHE